MTSPAGGTASGTLFSRAASSSDTAMIPLCAIDIASSPLAPAFVAITLTATPFCASSPATVTASGVGCCAPSLSTTTRRCGPSPITLFTVRSAPARSRRTRTDVRSRFSTAASASDLWFAGMSGTTTFASVASTTVTRSYDPVCAMMSSASTIESMPDPSSTIAMLSP